MRLAKKLIAVLLVLAPLSANAGMISILNSDFEADLTLTNSRGEGSWTSSAVDWVIVGGGGTFDPSTIPYPGGTDGRVAYANTGTLWQLTSGIFQTNSIYSLMVDIGDRADTSFAKGRIGLFAGSFGNTVTWLDLVAPTNGTFMTQDLSTAGLDLSAFIGQQIGIFLESDGIQINFDNVRLSHQPVPEPGTLGLFGLALLALRRFSKR